MSGIKSWPEGERPREKLLLHGPGALTEAELLALIIGSGDAASSRSAIDLGRQLLAEFKSLRTLSDASCAELQRVKGIGPAKAACIKAALYLSTKSLGLGRGLADETRFTSAQQVFEHFHYEFRDRRKEYFMALLLDGKNRIIKPVQISEGSLNQSIVHPREVFNLAVRDSAAAIILLHNHPSGDPTPSPEDFDVTRRLCDAGELMGIRVLDHIVLGDGSYYSFTEHGVI
ncbi:RadC family protein [Geomesophilobacter sediminis]|uniref:DNA repair protein RadC n=1 Tax=Geomesophilobacter sediminis TaxID=2798584 RepID=A0A8J7J1X7_9BACT|nr:DNA repair protein RadC [Geomesophilobacter sediminis]MBJ6724798.1 DNA repair protein RadC [Geomesophilobacter sediminis]